MVPIFKLLFIPAFESNIDAVYHLEENKIWDFRVIENHVQLTLINAERFNKNWVIKLGKEEPI